jgi:hypothetical protein
MPSITTQRLLGWPSPGSPGSSQEAAFRDKYLVRMNAVPVVKTLWVHRAVRVHFNALCLFMQKNGEKLGEKVDDWGFANRDIRGFAGIKSYHAFALAGDLEALENVLGIRATTFPIKKTREVAKLLGMKWGYDYQGRPDPMHFEFTGSRARARWIKSRLVKPTKRSRRLAELCNMDVKDFCNRIK